MQPWANIHTLAAISTGVFDRRTCALWFVQHRNRKIATNNYVESNTHLLIDDRLWIFIRKWWMRCCGVIVINRCACNNMYQRLSMSMEELPCPELFSYLFSKVEIGGSRELTILFGAGYVCVMYQSDSRIRVKSAFRIKIGVEIMCLDGLFSVRYDF